MIKSPTMTSLNAAVILNNVGVGFMEEGNIHLAEDHIRKALSLCRESCCRRHPPESDIFSLSSSPVENLELNYESSPRPAISRVCSIALLPIKLASTSASNENNEETKRRRKHHASSLDGFVDWTALKVKVEELYDEAGSVLLLSFTATYNLALCQHFRGIFLLTSTLDNNLYSVSLMKASRLYELAHTLLTRLSQHHEDICLVLIIVNNLSRVFHRLEDTRRAKLFSQRVLAVLVYVREHEGLNMGPGMHEQYLSNVCHLILRRNHTAPAA